MVPGEVPEIRSITRFVAPLVKCRLFLIICVRFPGQEYAGTSKVPTVIFYGGDGVPRAIGAESLQIDVIHDAECEGWHKAER
jgi:hypothetical protein